MALSAAKLQKFEEGFEHGFKVAASTTIYAGAMVMLSGGYAVPGADTASARFIGIAMTTVDNSAGADGAKTVIVRMPEAFRAKATGAAQATWVGLPVYLKDDEEVQLAAAATNDVKVGICLEVVSATEVIVLPDVKA